MKAMKKMKAVLLVLMILVSLCGCSQEMDKISEIKEEEVPLAQNSFGPMEFAKQLGAGWNLGNSLCCSDGSMLGEKSPAYYEKRWGNPIITQENIDTLKNSGFHTVRIPITYKNHIDENYHIEEIWLSRVKEVVDYVVKNDMYCVINLHHEDFLVADQSKKEVGVQGLRCMWTQIAEYFSEYNDHLIFEGFNEVINSKGQWDSADAQSYDVVNVYNQTFVDSVRATGGKNAQRYLIVNTYAAKATWSVLNGFVLPTDTIKGKLIVGVHIYDGIDKALNKFQYLEKLFISQEIPVFVGEWGLINSSVNTESYRVSYAERFLQQASELGIPCAWWDDGGIFKSSTAVTNYAILKRNVNEWYFKDLASTIVAYGTMASDMVEELQVETVMSNEEAVTNDDLFNMRAVSSWRSGSYTTNGKYVVNESRVALLDYQSVTSGEEYKANISLPNHRMVIRLVNTNNRLLKSYTLKDGECFTIVDGAVKMGVCIYASDNSIMNFEQYQDILKNDLEVYISKKGEE